MKKPQWITIGVAVALVAVILLFVRTIPARTVPAAGNQEAAQGAVEGAFSTDTILAIAKRQLSPEQSTRIAMLENSISRGAVRDQQLQVYHQLAHFWGDSMRFFPPYAWYEAESARLENSEKSLTFAGHLFLSSVLEGHDQNPRLIQWEALQAKDLFERSLKINPGNDSSKVGLGASYLFGNISASPMEGISKIREVADRDSSNIFAQMMLIEGSLMSGQFDKAISRLHTVYRIQPDNLDAILRLADVYERTGNKPAAIEWYRKSLLHVSSPEARNAIETRIADLSR